jgi:ubiquinone/menaquinone biosynthesis C-methylase UbiE
MVHNNASSSQIRTANLRTQKEKMAREYDEEAYPLFGQKLADLLVENLVMPPGAHVLQIGCGLGTTTKDLLSGADTDSRLIAVESSQSLLERARTNVEEEHVGRRAFFRVQNLANKLPFADNGFDCVLANVEFTELASPDTLICELVRITKPGGELRLATPLLGTWREFLDVYKDVLVRLDRTEMVEALRAYARTFPEPEALACRIEAAGMGTVTVETSHWELVFRTGREFFYAPVIELGPLARWKAIAGKGPEMQDIFLAVKEAIDTYFAGLAFGVSVYAGVFVGRKP